MEDSRIVDAYLARDESAIRHSAEKYGARLRALAYSILEDRLSAEECENDTYLQAWGAIPPHEPRDYLYAFLARITRHLSLDFCRRRSRLKRSAYVTSLGLELEDCIPDPNDLDCRLDELALKEALDAFLGSLSPQKRAIFLRRYWYLDSISAIAQRFGCGESQVKVSLHRCRRQLRAYLEKEGLSL